MKMKEFGPQGGMSLVPAPGSANNVSLILQNFEKTIWVQKIWMKVIQVFWTKTFSQSFEELAKCNQNISFRTFSI